MKTIFLIAALFVIAGLNAQEINPVQWSFSVKKTSNKTLEIHALAFVKSPWHLYSQHTPDGGPVPTSFEFAKNPLVKMEGDVKELGEMVKKKEEAFGIDVMYFNTKVEFVQTVVLKADVKTNLGGSVKYMVCNDKECLAPKTVPFSVSLQ